MEEIGIYHEHKWCIYSPLFYQNNSGEKWSTHLQYDCSAMTHVPPFWHCPGRQELWHSSGRWAGHLQSVLLEFWHGLQEHKSTSHRRPVNRGGQLQTRSLAPGVHVPAMAMLWKNVSDRRYCKHIFSKDWLSVISLLSCRNCALRAKTLKILGYTIFRVNFTKFCACQ